MKSNNLFDLSAKAHLYHLIADRQKYLKEYLMRENSSELFAKQQQNLIDNLIMVYQKIDENPSIQFLDELNEKIFFALEQPELSGVSINLKWDTKKNNFLYIDEFLPELKMLIR